MSQFLDEALSARVFEIASRQHGLARHHHFFLPHSSSSSRFTRRRIRVLHFEPALAGRLSGQ
jgi:hypothetical protein